MNNIQNYGMTNNYQTNFKGPGLKKDTLQKTLGITQEEAQYWMSNLGEIPVKSPIENMSVLQLLNILKASKGITEDLNRNIANITRDVEAGRISIHDAAKKYIDALA